MGTARTARPAAPSDVGQAGAARPAGSPKRKPSQIYRFDGVDLGRPLQVRGYGLSDVGRKRAANEDAFLVDDSQCLYVVADGMGGHAAGEVASSEAVEAVFNMVKRGLPELRRLGRPLDEQAAAVASRLVEAAVQAATYFVYSIAQTDTSKSGMGTTVSAALVFDSYAITAQVGDSRVYLIRNGIAEQLTEDHTLIGWQLKQGLITAEEAERSPHKNVITRAVGNREYVQVDTNLIPLEPGDRLLVCSDGLHGYLDESDIPPILTLGGRAAARRFIDLANERGGKDNITAIVVEVD
jgi:protein phosphatase